MNASGDSGPGSRRDAGVSPISVVLITLNEENNIGPCLDSLLTLDYPRERYEILVVDASTDRTPEIVAGYPGVRYLRSEKGFSRQKNLGLRESAFGLVAFTDADCLVPPNWLRVIHRAFTDAETAGIGGNALLPPGASFFEKCAAAVGHPAGGAIGFDANVSRGPGGIEFIAGCNGAFRKAAVLDVGGFDAEFEEGGEDVDLSRRFRRKGYLLDYIPDMTVYHRPRQSFRDYVRWNIRVGYSKFNLRRPGPFQLLLNPFFFLWPLAAVVALLALFLVHPGLGGVLVLAAWLSFLGILSAFTRPFPLLLRRRRRIGLGLFPVVTVVPFLIFVRQVCIHWGQVGKWIREHPAARA